MIVLTALAFTSGTAMAQNKNGWTCTAESLKSFRYKGGKTAYIHLSAYSSGGNYKVQKVSENKVVGQTKDKTPFECVKAN
jgi:hypothetical protein